MGGFSPVTYSLCKKLVSSVSTGISSIQLDPTDGKTLIFSMADGSAPLKVTLPVKTDAIDFQFVEQLPDSSPSASTIYIKKTNVKDTAGNSIYIQYMYIENTWRTIGCSGYPIASKNEFGLVKIDEDTIKMNTNSEICVERITEDILDTLFQ